MKILVIGNFGFGWDGSICDEAHIADALEELGHEVIRWQRDTLEGYKENVYQADVTLIAQWDGYPQDLWAYLPGKRVYWAFDYQADGQEWHEHLVKTSDVYLSKRIADSKYPNWCWLPQDFAPSFLDRFPNKVSKDIEILFTGSYLPWAGERTETLKAVDEKYNLVVHSVTPNEWKAQGLKNVHGPVMDDALPELIARAKINLSIDHTIEAGYWSDRNAQIMACGGFVLFRYVPLSETVFRDNIGYFNNEEDCLSQIKFYLDHERAREMIAENGYYYAQDNLKVRDRVRDLITIVRQYV